MKMLLVPLMMFSLNSFANCTYSVDNTQSQVLWTAFKTPKKVGVDGKFTKFQINTKTAQSELDLIKGATFTIDTTSVNTGNPGRDKTIFNSFFQLNKKPITLAGQVVSVNEKETKVLFDFNGTKKEVTMKNTIADGKITLNATIDMVEVGLNSSFAALHQACKALHEGKTWSDVNISVETVAVKKCSK